MPVTVEIPKESWTGKIREITLGATAKDGGTRGKEAIVGGSSAMPFLHFEGKMPHRPLVAIEIQEKTPNWPQPLLNAWGSAVSDPATWAKKAESVGADLLLLQLHGVENATSADGKQAAAVTKAVLAASSLPLIVKGPGQAEADNEMLVAVCEAAAGERVTVGNCEAKNYRTIVAAALANGHLVIASTPIDVNLAKQLNILISDMRMDLGRVLMDPTTGALGYGLEYTYSVMERLRLAALTGDGMTQQPMICYAGEESWRQKEARVGEGVPAEWGNWQHRGVIWETTTATSLLESGADILVVRHPETLRLVKQTIDKLMVA
jgi:acetyl-CoA decarbonylase/synthase, CODH/ACS complex subunit delta